MEQDSRSLWAKRVQRWKDSGLTAKEFAAEIGVNANTLSHWRWRLGREVGTASCTKPPRRPAKRKPAERPPVPEAIQFIEVTPPAAAPVDTRFEIALRRGRRVFVPAIFDGDALGRLVDVLEARG
jgi:transposase